MSIKSEIQRIRANVSSAYAAVEEKGGTLPSAQNSAGLAEAVRSIPAGGGASPGTPLDPVEVYKNTRPADWLPMPEPQDNEMYLLFHIPDGVSSLLAFTVTCTGSYTVALGTVTGGKFVQQSAVSVASGGKYEAELFARNFGDLTSMGMKQCMVKVSGTNILTWEPSTHSKKPSPANFASWNIVEISCRLPEGGEVACGRQDETMALQRLRYFSWYGKRDWSNGNMSKMFYHCCSLVSIPAFDTVDKDGFGISFAEFMFYGCRSLLAIPELHGDIGSTAYMFSGCYSLTSIPPLDMSSALSTASMFSGCSSLASVPRLNTWNTYDVSSMFFGCSTLIHIPLLILPEEVEDVSGVFGGCYALEKIALVTSNSEYWDSISLSDCSLGHQALLDLFSGLSALSESKNLVLTGNPGVAELTDAEKAIATGKNWTLTL